LFGPRNHAFGAEPDPLGEGAIFAGGSAAMRPFVRILWRLVVDGGVEEKAMESRRAEPSSLAPSRRDKWLIIGAAATLMFIFDGLQVQ